jgi:hypothetical protein
MERMTEKHYLGTDHYIKCSGNCNVDMDCIDCPSFDCLVERLAAYEDTGLTPEEVTALQKDWSDRCTVTTPLAAMSGHFVAIENGGVNDAAD